MGALKTYWAYQNLLTGCRSTPCIPGKIRVSSCLSLRKRGKGFGSFFPLQLHSKGWGLQHGFLQLSWRTSREGKVPTAASCSLAHLHREAQSGEPRAAKCLHQSKQPAKLPGAGPQARTGCLAPPLPMKLVWAQPAVKPGDPSCWFTFLQGQASASLRHSDRSKGRSGLARPHVPISKGSTSAHGSATTCARRRAGRGRAGGGAGAALRAPRPSSASACE